MCYIETGGNNQHESTCIPTTLLCPANLDGETNLKIRSALAATANLVEPAQVAGLSGHLETELPNRQLYEFAGNLQLAGEGGQPLSLSATQLLLRGARLRNTTWVYGLVVYTGHESKLLMNSTKTPLKRSTIDIVTNYQVSAQVTPLRAVNIYLKIIFLFGILVCLALISAIGNTIKISTDPGHEYFRFL